MTEVFQEDVEEFLEHFGVKGMKWGVRRELNRQLQSERKRRTKRQQLLAVERARGAVGSGQVRREIKEARKQYRISKKTKGKEAALKTLNKAKNKRYKTVATANQYKSGKEKAAIILGAIGVVALSSIAAAASR